MSQVTKVTITIETTNAAFHEGANFGEEYNYVLDQAKLIDGLVLRDHNGNSVGTVEVETE